MTDELAALRARVAELEGLLRRVLDDEDPFHFDSATNEAAAYLDGVTPTPDPRDARIAELEAALREVRQWLYGESPPNFDREWRELQGICDRALGDGHG